MFPTIQRLAAVITPAAPRPSLVSWTGPEDIPAASPLHLRGPSAPSPSSRTLHPAQKQACPLNHVPLPSRTTCFSSPTSNWKIYSQTLRRNAVHGAASYLPAAPCHKVYPYLLGGMNIARHMNLPPRLLDGWRRTPLLVMCFGFLINGGTPLPHLNRVLPLHPLVLPAPSRLPAHSFHHSLGRCDCPPAHLNAPRPRGRAHRLRRAGVAAFS